MATLQRQKGKYWYLIESVRVNGKPRPKILAYLGTAENILEKLSGEKPASSKSYEYGPVAVVDNFIKKLNIDELFNGVCFGKNIPLRNKLSFGRTMASIIIHRAVNPGSKRSFGNWSKKTFLPQMYNFMPEEITSQHFWDMMDFVTEEHIRRIESTVTKKVIEDFKIKLDTLLYDYTNFYTFIDTNNKKNTIAKRGKNKQKRDDLRQFGLALLVAREFKIPLFSDIYEGNRNDSKEFDNTIDRIKTRLGFLSDVLESITLVFDKGSNSKDNFDKIGKINFVGSLSLAHDKELKETPYSKFYRLEMEPQTEEQEEQTILCYRTQKQIWGEDKTVVMYKSESLYIGQLAGLRKDLQETEEELGKLQESGDEGFYFGKHREKKVWTLELFEKEVESKINKQFVRDVVEFKIKEKKGSRFKLSFRIDKEKVNLLKKTVLGKRILISTRHAWSDKEIIEAYHGQADVEQSFRQMKNPFHNCVRPQYHWTDQKIIVHTFCSILAFTVSALIEKVARENGFSMTVNEIYDRLKEIRKVKYIYQEEKKNNYKITYGLEKVEDETTQKLFDLLMK